jgi:hypothetical protein
MIKKLTQDQKAAKMGLTKGQMNYRTHGKKRDERLKAGKEKFVVLYRCPITGLHFRNYGT